MGRHHNSNLGHEDRQPLDRKLTQAGALTVVLFQPRIPQNTGSIARLCAATGSRLDLINPLFEIDDRKLRRAGLDYWHLLDVRNFVSLQSWFENFEAANKDIPLEARSRLWLVEVGAKNIYSDVTFREGDFLMFGDEQEGIPSSLINELSEFSLRLPQQGVRSLNLSNVVSIVVYEALRQLNWLKLEDV